MTGYLIKKTDQIFNHDTNNPNKIVLSEHTKILNDKIIDTKYNRSIKLSNNIYLYNTNY